MTATYTPGAGPRDTVRMLIPDRNEDTAIFSDEELDVFIALEGANVKRSVACAIETIATDQALLLKVLKLGDDQTDGAKLSDALLKRAKTLRDQAATEIAILHDGEGLFDIAEQVVDGFSAREYRWKAALRG